MAIKDSLKNLVILNRKSYLIIVSLIISAIVLLIVKKFFPQGFEAFVDFVWLISFTAVVIFIGLGTLVILGLRKEASKLLDMLLEGSLTIVDFFNFLRDLVASFIEQLRAFLVFLAPLFSYSIALVLYLFLIFVYKAVGVVSDVTILTIVLTVAMITGVALLSRTKDQILEPTTWIGLFFSKIRHHFTDGLEITIFLFFLTMERTDLFFLPSELNVPLRAEMFGYDLMLRGITLSQLHFTITVVVVSVTMEIVRQSLRVGANANYIYNTQGVSLGPSRSERIKNAIRLSFSDSKDEVTRLVAFTTVLIFVFLFFPRLKLLAVAVTSLTAFALDLLMPSRLSQHSDGTDLVSRVLAKITRIDRASGPAN